MRAVLPAAAAQGVRVLSNMGAADPLAAGRKTAEIAAALGLDDRRCAVLLGDDVQDAVAARPGLSLMETGAPLESILPRMASANAYLGADAVAAALETGAPVVVTGRVADPSLFVGPIVHALDWGYDDYVRLAQATATGHLLECAGQVTGGYFADPGVKDVPGLARLGFPFADVTDAGAVTIGKCAGSGGRIDAATCTEQLLYEVDDPAAYVTPDCVLDMSGIAFNDAGPDRVVVSGARAQPRTGTYKVSIGYFDGYLGEGQLSYGGPNAVARARLAGQIVAERLRLRGFAYDALDARLIGIDSLHGPGTGRPKPYEVRLRVTGRTQERKAAEAVGFEVAALYTNGPAGGAGGRGLGPRNPRRAVGAAAARSGHAPRRSGGRRLMLTVRDLAHARAGDKGSQRQRLRDRLRRGGLRAAQARADRGARGSGLRRAGRGPGAPLRPAWAESVQFRRRACAGRRRHRDRRARHPRQELVLADAHDPAAGQRAGRVARISHKPGPSPPARDG